MARGLESTTLLLLGTTPALDRSLYQAVLMVAFPPYDVRKGWRANVARRLDPAALLKHQDTLRETGVNLAALVHYPSPATAQLKAGGGQQMLSLETFQELSAGTMGLAGPVIDSILEGSLTPTSWKGRGPLPMHLDGLRQTQIVAAIVESSKTGRPVTVAR